MITHFHKKVVYLQSILIYKLMENIKTYTFDEAFDA